MGFISLRQKQMDSLTRLLNPSGSSEDKVLVFDPFCKDILTLLFNGEYLRKHGVTVCFPLNHVKELTDHGFSRIFLIDDPRPVEDLPAVYFVQPTDFNIQKIKDDASRSLYHSYHLIFSSPIPPKFVEESAASGAIYFIHSTGVDLARGMRMPDIDDFSISFSSSRGHLPSKVPIFRKFLEQPAQYDQYQYDVGEKISKVHDQYLEFFSLEDNMFSLAQQSTYVQMNDPSADKEETIERIVKGLLCVLETLGVVPLICCPLSGPAEKVASLLNQKLKDEGGKSKNSSERPLLCIFERNFDLSVGIQHDFRYRPLVHDLLGLKLNRLKVQGQNGVMRLTQLDSLDPFWSEKSFVDFAEVAKLFQSKTENYLRKAIECASSKKGLREPLGEYSKKKEIDKHTDIGKALFEHIKERSIDDFSKKESEMMRKGRIDRTKLMAALEGKGTKMDKLRFAIIYLLSTETIKQSEVEEVEAALNEAEVDTSAFQYVKMIKSSNASLSRNKNKDKANKLCDMSKSWLSRDQHLSVVSRTVKSITAGKLKDSFQLLDPFSSSGSKNITKGDYRDVIVFMVGGGNYAEFGDLQELKTQGKVENVIYGATEILTGADFVEQFGLLGRKI